MHWHVQVPAFPKSFVATIFDGTVLSGVGALVGGIAAFIVAAAALFKGKSWLSAFRSKLELVNDRDALATYGKHLVQESLAASKAAEGWKQAYEAVNAQHEALVQSNRDLVKSVHAAIVYIRQLVEHSLALEQQMRQNNVLVNIELPPMPTGLAQVQEYAPTDVTP